jgi:DNA-binding NtrC family response regulator
VAAGTDGQVTLETVKRHVTTQFAAPGPLAFTQAQYDHALEHGLAGVVEDLQAGIIRHNLAENHGKKAATLKQLGISKRLLYSVVGKAQK